MTSEWNHFALGEITELVIDYRGKTPKKLGGDWCKQGYRALSAKNIKTGRIVQAETIRYIDESLYRKWMKDEVQRGDILITSEAPFGQIFFWDSDEKIVLSQRLFCVRIKPEYDARFIYYYMTTPEFQSELDGRATGTTVIGLRQPELMKCIIRCPEIQEQKVIAAILSSIDAKIIANEKVNDNLQQQAKSLYEEMFLNDPDADMVSGTLSDIATITMGQSPSGSSYNEESVGEVFYQGRAEFGFRFPTRRLFTTEPKRMAEPGDVLLSVRAPVGDLNVAYEKCCIGRGLGAIHSKTGDSSFMLYTMFALKPQLDVFNGEGTVFGSINRDGLSNLPVNIPSPEEIAKFEAVVRPMDNLIRTNYEEICRLQSIRDSLLPKLMSGEIDVSAVQL